MKNRFRVFHLAAICTALFVTGAARMSGQNGQALRITKGPILEEVTSDSAVIAWSTNMQGSTNVIYGSDPRNLSHLAEAANNSAASADVAGSFASAGSHIVTFANNRASESVQQPRSSRTSSFQYVQIEPIVAIDPFMYER